MKRFLTLCIFIALIFMSCNTNDKETKTEAIHIQEDVLAYSADSLTMNGFVAFNNSSHKKRPVILIVHEWWGLTDYPKNRAKQLAEMGYLAMAVDFYGNGLVAESPEEAGALALPFYKDPEMAKRRFDAALTQIKSHPAADTSNIAAIGYCFGGAQVLNMARMGSDLKGVVSFHGNLTGAELNKDVLKARILVCHGEADEFVPAEEVNSFKHQMDSAKINYVFKSYPGATHAFTNPGATEKGIKYKIPIRYNEAADKASWNDLKVFFEELF